MLTDGSYYYRESSLATVICESSSAYRFRACTQCSARTRVMAEELGFVSHEELKAREPKLPSPKNEAERLLNVLEAPASKALYSAMAIF